ncbi:hypothetical protein F4823DRAFT_579468 [Ustulina deusta]|nr:hypothetical protein F4823DRAFT_579468 [Ustulina deusta]
MYFLLLLLLPASSSSPTLTASLFLSLLSGGRAFAISCDINAAKSIPSLFSYGGGRRGDGRRRRSVVDKGGRIFDFRGMNCGCRVLIIDILID